MTEYKALSAIEQAELQDEVEALRQRVAELSAYVEELRQTGMAVVDRWYTPDWSDGTHTLDYIVSLRNAISKAKPQSIHDRDMRIAEAVREACAEVASDIVVSCPNNPRIIPAKERVMKLNLSDVLEKIK